MWFPTDNRPPSTHNTPRTDRRLPKLNDKGSTISRKSDRPVVPPVAQGNKGGGKPFFVEDDRRSKITVVSLKSDRTSRTVQTLQSALSPRTPVAPPPKGAKGMLIKAKTKVKDGFRQSSIKRIVASGLCVATTLLFLFGVFLPFWNVYTYTVDDVTTGYYGGLWNYCLRVTGGSTSCTMYTEYYLAHWFRAVRFLELMAFMGMLGLMGLVIAYMFFFREIKYIFLQWIIIGLCFGTALFSLLGLIVYASSYSNSSHISSAYGLTFCAFFGATAAGVLFLWDKLTMGQDVGDATMGFRGLSGYQSSRATKMRSRLSHVKSTRSHGQRSTDRATVISKGSSVPRSTRLGANPSTGPQLTTTEEV